MRHIWHKNTENTYGTKSTYNTYTTKHIEYVLVHMAHKAHRTRKAHIAQKEILEEKMFLGNYFVSYGHVCTMFLSVEPKL